MKLATVEIHGSLRAGAVKEDHFVDLTTSFGAEALDIGRLFALEANAAALAERHVRTSKSWLPLSSVKLRSPIVFADKILGVGMNYRSFVEAAEDHGITVPKERLWFYRPRSCLTGPYDAVWLPRNADDLDYEAELALIIGKRCSRVAAVDAPSFIAGFTVANDLTLRGRVLKSPVYGKSFDTHTPLGPWLVTRDEIIDPHALELRTWVNGELRQQSTSADMITNCYELIADISTACTLNPGDIILTGTPAGCGVFQRPPAALKVGDVVKIEIAGIGVIENRIVEEPAIQAS